MGMLRRLFGPSRKEIWKQLSDQMGGRFTSGTWKGERVDVSHDAWTLTLDSYVVSTGKVIITYTRMRAPFVNPDGFRFTIHRKSIFSGIGKFLGLQDVEIGHPRFDEDFIIKGNDESKLRALFASEQLRALIAAQPEIHFAIRDDEGWFGKTFPEGVDELVFAVAVDIRDLERLKALFELFAETLEQLCRIGSAYETEPGVTL